MILKKIPVIGFMLLNCICFSQNWKPLNTTEVFNYKLNDAEFITNSIWVEDYYGYNGDTIYNLNRIVDYCDSMPDVLTVDAGQFLMKEIQFDENNVFRFQNPDTFDIHIHANIGDEWSFNSNGITAEIVSKIETNIFGNVDSIKTILLSTNDTIIISKGHGIVKFPDFEGGYYNLVGIEGRDLGEQEPKFNEFFDFEVGDVFQYFEEEYDYFDQYAYTYKHTITSIDNSGDSIVLSVDLKGFKDYYEYDGMNSTYLYTDYFNQEDILFYVNSANHQTNQYPNTPFEYGNIGIIGHRINDFNIYTKGMGCGYGAAMYQYYPEWPYLASVEGGYQFYEFSLGLGLTSREFFGCTYSFSMNMIGFVKDGDTTGTVYSDSYLLSSENEAFVKSDINLYPNPAKDFMQIEGVKEGFYKIIDLQGKTLMQENVGNNSNKLRLSLKDIPKGAYVIVLYNQDSIERRKFIKE